MDIFKQEAEKFCRKKHIKFATPTDFKPIVNRKVVTVTDTELEDTDILPIFLTKAHDFNRGMRSEHEYIF